MGGFGPVIFVAINPGGGGVTRLVTAVDTQAAMWKPSVTNQEKAFIIGGTHNLQKKVEMTIFAPSEGKFSKKVPIIGAGMLKKAPIIGTDLFTNPPIRP